MLSAKLGVPVEYVPSRDYQASVDMFKNGDVHLAWFGGLTGVQAGSTVQLDIPSDLAYGPDANGDIIGENEALTFLIEVRAVIQPPDPADAPTEAGVPESEGATDTTFDDLREGLGAMWGVQKANEVFGAADLIAIGRPYITNPDLVERFRNGWPLAPVSDPSTWYSGDGGAEGYTDFPTFDGGDREKES